MAEEDGDQIFPTPLERSRMKPLEYRWEHAVNSSELLRRVEQQIRDASVRGFRGSAYVNAIEADIIFSERQRVPVMGHPPDTDGELTLETFLTEMIELAKLFVDAVDFLGETPLIVKLDFKSDTAFQAASPLLRKFVVDFPFTRSIFINADILVGPANTQDVHFSANDFLRSAAGLGSIDGPNDHKIVLSVGWTTSNGNEEEFTRPYSHAMIDEMMSLLKPYNHFNVTFPLRATCCRASWDAIRKLLAGPPAFGFTLWWAKTQMDDAEIEWLFHTLEETHDERTGASLADRTFYDILGFEGFLARRKNVD